MTNRLAGFKVLAKAYTLSLSLKSDSMVPENPAEMAATSPFGLLDIQERAELIRAQVVLKSAPGTGTILTIVRPESSWS